MSPAGQSAAIEVRMVVSLFNVSLLYSSTIYFKNNPYRLNHLMDWMEVLMATCGFP